MHPLDFSILALYFVTLALLSLYGLHRSLVIYLYFRHRQRRAVPVAAKGRLPRVTVQLPLYNEMYVVERLLESVSRIRYPRERLEVQVLDDSTDETTAIAGAAVERLRGQGLDIHYMHRDCRTGYKAGALQAGLQHARGELILVFDADFVAPADILEATVGLFQDPSVGMVQVRWDHVNRDYSLLTQVQSILLDGHFVLEHGGRSRSGRFFNFNGTAGVWRREAIVEAGGWQHDTLTEDLDLSYRAQLAGWRFVFLQDVASCGELPVEMNAFKTQQHRWAKGSIQTCRKLLPRVLAAKLPLRIKLEAAIHLSANLCYPLLLLLAVLMLPAMLVRCRSGLDGILIVEVPLFLGATASLCSFYALSQRELFGRGWTGRLKYLPAVLATGIGLSINNTGAVLEALLGRDSEFARTPKYRVEEARDEWQRKRYRVGASPLPLLELLFGLYFVFAAYYAVSRGLLAMLPFVLLFLAGFLCSASVSLLEAARRTPLEAARNDAHPGYRGLYVPPA
jgi:cellulose synthase/poly-beta-1,6-N-acetylglucosamine synthase-like glycosyltransferase